MQKCRYCLDPLVDLLVDQLVEDVLNELLEGSTESCDPPNEDENAGPRL